MPVEREIKGQDHSLQGMGESQHGPTFRPEGWASTLPHAYLDGIGGGGTGMSRAVPQEGTPTLAKPPRVPWKALPRPQTSGHKPCPLTRCGGLAPSLPAQGSSAGDWGTHRSLPVGVGEDSVNFHLALVGLGHVHPQLPAAGLAGTIDTGHVVAVVVLLSLSKTEPTGGMRNQDAKNHRVWMQEFMALPGGQGLDARIHGPPRRPDRGSELV